MSVIKEISIDDINVKDNLGDKSSKIDNIVVAHNVTDGATFQIGDAITKGIWQLELIFTFTSKIRCLQLIYRIVYFIYSFSLYTFIYFYHIPKCLDLWNHQM